MKEKVNYNYPYWYYPNTEVLVNNFDIKDNDLLVSTERKYVSLRMLDIKNNPVKGSFDENHLKNIHSYLFQDVYPWAGEFRNCEIGKGIPFCYVSYISDYSKDIFRKLKKKNYYIDLPINEKFTCLVDLFGDLNSMHPFREGNGRTQREFITALGRINGLDFNISKVDRDEMISASIKSLLGDNRLLGQIFQSRTTVLSNEEQLNYIDKYCDKNLADFLKKSIGSDSINNGLSK